MRVVLSGYYGFDNVGDEAILSAMIQALRKHHSEIDITVLSNNPTSTRTTHQVHAVNRWKVHEVYSAIKRADGLISGGGSLLQDETGIKSIPYYTGVIGLAACLRKPVFVYAQGMGPFRKTYNQWIVKQALQRVSGITVRDDRSKQLLKRIGIKQDIQVVPDPVIGMEVVQLESNWLDGKKLFGKVVAVSVRDWVTNTQFKEKIARALDLTKQSGMHIMFIPMHGKQDYDTSKEVANMMKEESIIAPYNTPIEEKISLIHHADLLVGMRLHALIFAAIGSTPFIALSYDPKVDAFAKIANQPLAGHVAADNWTVTSLFQLIRQMSDNIEESSEKLIKSIRPLRKKAKETAAFALSTFHQQLAR